MRISKEERKSKNIYYIIQNLFSLPKRQWSRFINDENRKFCGDKALDLLNRMLVYDHAERITPKEALEHEYFTENSTAIRAKAALANGNK